MIVDANAFFGSWPRRRLRAAPADLAADMAAARVDRACVSSLKGYLYDAREGNEDTLAAARTSPSLIPVGVFDVHRAEDPEREIDAEAERGFRFFRFWSERQGTVPWTASSLVFRRALAVFADRGIPIMISAACDLAALDAALGEAPRGSALTVAVSGVGYPILADAIELMRRRGNIIVETSWLTTPDGIERVVAAAGDERVVLGSHYPFQSITAARLIVERASLSDRAKENILGANILRLAAEGGKR